MRGSGCLRAWFRPFTAGIAAALVLSVVGPSAQAFEYFDGRLQVHGFFEQQVRALSNNFDMSDDLDLAAWQQILNIETEYDFAPAGWGPFDVLSGFVRLEARYDCVWTRACGIFPSADQFGNRAAHLPGVKASGRDSGFSGSFFLGDANSGPFNTRRRTARFLEQRVEPTLDGRAAAGQPLANPIAALNQPRNHRRPAGLDQIPGFSALFGVRGPNQEFERGGDDPAFFFLSRQLGCRFGVRSFPGGANGVGNQIIGPIDPKCEADARGALAGKPNPFNPSDFVPILAGTPSAPFGSGELPARAASEFALGTLDGGGGTRSTGLFLPSAGVQRAQGTRHLDDPKQNFSQGQLAWNRGDSQGWERELKEAYLDMEFFDSRLWVRAGRQSIVWGKTELFRTTDQFNPQDLALSSLPSLEESRVALWSIRGVWSLYDVGPLEDVRLELAANFDQFKPSDIGQCGEPFTALVACNKRTGLFVNGLFGFGLAGEDRPDSPWQDIEALEFGARVEFRLGRFSFQISDFNGYDDLPYADLVQTFERRVDPETGRPLRATSRGSCTTGFEDACLPIRSNLSLNGLPSDPNANPSAQQGFVSSGGIVVESNRGELLSNFGSNLQIFTVICATSFGFTALDPTSCAQSVFNSRRFPNAPVEFPRSDKNGLTIATLLSNTLAGAGPAATAVGSVAGAPLPVVELNNDPCDRFFSDGMGGCLPVVARTGNPIVSLPSGSPNGGLGSLNERLTDEQEALLGCGPFWGTDCEADGIDLLNADAGVLLQSFVGFPGSYTPEFVRSGYSIWNLANGEAQPGTIVFLQNGSSLPAGRFVGGRTIQLPGARSHVLPDGVTPNDDPVFGFDVDRDGCATPLAPGCQDANALVIPAAFGASAGQQFASEMAALSFNLQIVVTAFSLRAAGATTSENNEFDPDAPFAAFDPTDPSTDAFRGKCSFAQPQFCTAIQALLGLVGSQRNSVRAGGSEDFGRPDFVWHSGGQAILRHTRRNVLGFSFDFAEDVTKSNWSSEFTWIDRQRFTDNSSRDGSEESGTINLTISVDRPTFIDFLNANRTFFFNSQFFFQYITDYNRGFTANGPFNVLGTFTAQTGYFQDRMLPGVTFVYDRRSNSGAALASIIYRFTENFSGAVGANFFFGRFQTADVPIQPIGPASNQVGRGAFTSGVENGLAVVRERDELFLRLRYTF